MEWSNSFRKFNVKASSMAESVMATVIISICILLAINIYTLVFNQTISDVNSLAKFEVDRIMLDVRSNHNYESVEYQYEKFKINKRVNDYGGAQDLKEVRFLVTNERDTIMYNFLISSNQ